MRRTLSSTLGRILVSTTVLAALATGSVAQSVERVIYSFTGASDGGSPLGGMVFDKSGNLYGTTSFGGDNGWGTVFQLKPNTDGSWTQHTLYSFQGLTTGDGAQPYAGLTLDSKGNLYGTTLVGGSTFSGTVFELSPGTNNTWTEKIIYSFSGGIDGLAPYAGATFDSSGNLFGATDAGGRYGFGVVFELVAGQNGSWTIKTLHDFTGGNDGGAPFANVIFDTVGNLYGMTLNGGAHDYGAAFQLTLGPNGVWTEHIVHAFTGGGGGASSLGGLTMDSAGNLYTEASSAIVQFTPGTGGASRLFT